MINKSQAVLVPEMPKMVAKEQILLYVPVASKENYGTVKLGDSADGNYYFKSENGVLNLDVSKVINYMAGDILSSAAGSAQAAANSALAASEAQTTVQSLANDANKSANSAKDSADAAAKLLTRSNLISTIGTVPTTVWGNGVGLMTETQSKNLATLTNLLYEKDPEFIDNLNEVLAAFKGMGEDATLINLIGEKANQSDVAAEFSALDKKITDNLTRTALVNKIGLASATISGLMPSNHYSLISTLLTILEEDNVYQFARELKAITDAVKAYENDSVCVGGIGNTVISNRAVIAGGNNNELRATNGFIGGGKENFVKGTGGFATGYRNKVCASIGAAIGVDIEIGDIDADAQVNRTFGIGAHLKSNTDYQFLLGVGNVEDAGAAVIIGGGGVNKGHNLLSRKNIYTFPKTGSSRTGVNTDVVNVGSFYNVAKSKIPNAESVATGASGFMTRTQSDRLQALFNLLGDNPDGAVNTINEVFKIFEQYPDETAVIDALAAKADKKSVDSALTALDRRLTNAFTREALIEKIGLANEVADGLMSAVHVRNLANLMPSNGTDGLAYEIADDGTYAICIGAGESYTNDIVISSSYATRPVKVIGDVAFLEESELTSVTIPSSVTSIGDQAFDVCTSLASVIFTGNSQLTKIGDGAFMGCAFTSIIIPSSVTSVGQGAFAGCENLKTVTFAEGSQLTSISNSMFGSCISLESITIPSNVTRIDDYAFVECENLKTVTFAEGSQLTSIGESVFDTSGSLASITIPASVTSIGMWAFLYCDVLETVYYGGSESDWDRIEIGLYNEPLLNATRYYYSETQPTTSGNYWHYVDGKETIWEV